MTTATRRIARPTEAVRRDHWDREDFADTVEMLPKLATARERLAAHTDVADDLLADLHAAFLRHRPELNDDVAATHARNRAVMGEVFQTEQFGRLRASTVTDPLAAGLATTAIAGQLDGLFEKLGDVAELEQRAADAERSLEELLDRLGDGELDDADQGLVDQATEEAGQARAALDAAVADAEPLIGRAVRAGAKAAQQAADQHAAACKGWGQDPGEFARRDPADRLALMQRMDDERLTRIAAAFGRLRWELAAEVQRSFTNGPTELHTVKLGADLDLVLPSEFVALGDPDLELEFLLRYVERQLLQYEVRERPKKARGPIVMVQDCSLSMEGDEETFAFGLGLTLLSIAKAQQRGFVAITFHGPGTMETFEFVKPADFELSKMLDYASVRCSGGTDFEGPVGRARDICMADHTATGLEGADIVFITDGLANVTKPWLDRFLADQRTAGFRLWCIAIARTVPKILRDLSELSATVEDLLTGGDVAAIFKRLAANYDQGVPQR